MDRRSLLRGFMGAGCAAAALAPCAAMARARKEAPSDAVGMLFDSTRCIGCKTCVVACREANGTAPAREAGGLHDLQTDLDAQTYTVIKLAHPGSATASGGPGASAAGATPDLPVFVKNQCMHCVDPACVSVCMLGSLKKREFGIVTWDEDICVGCRYCQVACPFGVPKFEFDTAAPKLTKCTMCVDRLKAGREPACTEVCPRDAIIYGPLEALKREAHARIDANPGRYQPKVYGEHDAGGTQVLYLSGIPFEQLGLPSLGDEGVPAMSEKVTHGIMQGMATPVVLYAAGAAVIWRNYRKQHAHDEAAAAPSGKPEEKR